MILSRLISKHGSKVVALIYGAIIVFILLLAYTGNIPPILNKIPYYDTFGHLILYGLASYLGHLAFKHRRMRLISLSLPLWPFLFGIFTIVEELLQAFSPNRTFSLIDMVASLLGVFVGCWLAEKQRIKSNQE